MSREVRLSDRIKQISHGPSVNAFSFDSVPNGFSPFRDFYQDGDVLFYAATDGIRYEVGSGEYTYRPVRGQYLERLTRYPLRSNQISAGPYFVNGSSNSGPTEGSTGHFSPLYLTKSAASGLRGYPTPSTAIESVKEYTFSEFPGVTFYGGDGYINEAAAYSVGSVSGENYAASGAPVNFQGVTEVFVTYPGKYSVFTGAGVSGFQEPKKAGLAFWGNEQTLDYDVDIVWITGSNSHTGSLGIQQPNPEFAIDVGGLVSYSQIRASGFVDGGSGIAFSGGQALEQDILKIASGGRQLEPFYRNELDNQTKTNQVFSLSGLVDQRILFKTQYKGMVFAGPESGCVGSCSPDYPEFRYLVNEDIPDLSDSYVVQKNNFSGSEIPNGAVAFTNQSGTIEYDKQFVFDSVSNSLGVATNNPQATLDVNGDVKISGDLMVKGGLDIQGNLTYIDSQTVTIQDHQIELGSVSGTAFDDDTYIDDGGIVLKSSDGDKKWTWINANDAWTTNQKIDVSGIIFNDFSSISGAYRAGSGLVLDDGIVFNVGNLFQVSGSDQNTGYLHQNSVLVVSGVSGINTTYNNGLLTINPSFLHNSIFDKIDASGNRALGLASGLVVSSGNLLDNFIQETSGWADYKISQAAGGYGSWSISAQSGTPDNITTTENVDFSGVHVDFSYDSVSNTMIASAAALSGWSRNTALSYAEIAATASGQAAKDYTDSQISSLAGGYGQWQFHDGDNEVLDDISSDDVLTVSGVTGVAIDYNSTTNLLKLSAAPVSGYFQDYYRGWQVKARGGANNSSIYTTTVLPNDGLEVRGVSGIVVDYNPTLSGIINISAEGISGWVNTHAASKLYSDASGALVSGYAYNVSQMISSISAPAYGSGLVKQNGVVDFRHDGSGTLKHLRFDEAVRVGDGAFVDSSGFDSTSLAVGFQALSGVDYAVNAIGLGYLAGAEASGITRSIMIGRVAGYNSHNMTNSIMIGYNAGRNAEGEKIIHGGQNTFIGTQAGGDSWNSQYSNYIGRFTGAGTSGVIISDGIGRDALLSANSLSYVEAIGYKAGASMSGVRQSVAIGYGAGSGVFASDSSYDLNMIGYNAGANNYQNYNINAIGQNAYYGSASGLRVNAIGLFAGMNAQTLSYCDLMGLSAGRSSSALTSCVGIGRYSLEAAQSSADVVSIGTDACSDGGVFGAGVRHSNSSSSVFIGSAAGRGSYGATNVIAIGNNAGAERNAGYVADPATFPTDQGYNTGSIFLGNYAGYSFHNPSTGYVHTPGSYNLIIEPYQGYLLTDWAPNNEPFIISIAQIIHGYSKSTVSQSRNLQIGKKPSSLTELQEATLTIAPQKSTDTVLKLDRVYAQADPLLSAVTASSSDNTVINNEGYLSIPIATTKVGSDIFDASGNKISRISGTVAIWAPGGSSGTSYVIVCVAGVWFRTTALSAL